MSGSADTDSFPSRRIQSNERLKHVKVTCFKSFHGRMSQVLRKNTGSIINQTGNQGEKNTDRQCEDYSKEKLGNKKESDGTTKRSVH